MRLARCCPRTEAAGFFPEAIALGRICGGHGTIKRAPHRLGEEAALAGRRTQATSQPATALQDRAFKQTLIAKHAIRRKHWRRTHQARRWSITILDFMMWITVVGCLIAVLVLGWGLVAFAKYLFYRAQR